jgi:CRP/FNR family transcriptional regulator, cyclic AMP receptor protein
VDPEALRRVSLFATLSRGELEKLAGWTFEVEVPQGEDLIREGRLAHEFFVIEDGAVEVRRHGERIAELGPGDFFGEVALLGDGRRTASVTTTTEARLIVMSTSEFRRMEQELPEVAERVHAALRERLVS